MVNFNDGIKLTKEEKDEAMDFLWDNLLDSGCEDDWYLGSGMKKILEYVGYAVPQTLTVRYSDGSTYKIGLHYEEKALDEKTKP